MLRRGVVKWHKEEGLLGGTADILLARTSYEVWCMSTNLGHRHTHRHTHTEITCFVWTLQVGHIYTI